MKIETRPGDELRQGVLQLVGVPYLRGGTDPQAGFDCFTLMEYIRREFYGRPTPHAGIPAPTLTSMQAAALGIQRALGAREHVPSPWVVCEPPRDGCAVGLGRTRFSRLHHCGVLVDGHVCHALEGAGVVLTPIERVWYLYGRVEFFECQT